MRKIEYVISDERLITPSGLLLGGQVLGKSNLIKKANRMRTQKSSQPQIENGGIPLIMIGLLSIRKFNFENVNEFHTDEGFYKNALVIVYKIPAVTKPVCPVLTKILTATHRSLTTSKQRAISAMQSVVKAGNIVSLAHWDSCLKRSQRQS